MFAKKRNKYDVAIIKKKKKKKLVGKQKCGRNNK